jgi:hypothetical protein
MSRGLAGRIEKLEARRREDGEMLLLWRLPGQDVAAISQAARRAGLFTSGDLVVSAEWLGEDPTPAPRWVKVSPSGRLGLLERERGYCELALRNIVDHSTDMRPDPTLVDWTDAELWQFALGVDT